MQTVLLFFLFAFLLGVSSAAADPLPNDAKISAAIDYEGDQDSYTFTVNAGESVRLTVTDTSATGELWPQILLYGPTGAQITFGNDHGDEVAILQKTFTEQGTYTVLVTSYYKSLTGSYELTYMSDGEPIPVPAVSAWVLLLLVLLLAWARKRRVC